ncbi:hypothetical protein [Clostridium sp.]|uniref:hypothetical protein n=1 Tax=Clostridium sp. TaxID=1506 RepID=UPI0026348E21|nr:hypothetical protein [Clostridium sp.]
MNYFEFRDVYLNILIKLTETTHQIYSQILNELNETNKDERYDKYLILNLIEFTNSKIENFMNYFVEAVSIPYEVGILKIVKAICKINCYLYSINIRTEQYTPEYNKKFKIIYHIYIEEAKDLFNQLGYVEATMLIISSDKLLWERQDSDFSIIKAKSLKQLDDYQNKKLS